MFRRNIEPDAKATLLEIATLCGVDEKLLRSVGEKYGLKPAAKGSWPLRETVSAVVAYFRGQGDPDAKADMKAEQLRKLTAERKIAEVEAEQKLKTHISTEESLKQIEKGFRVFTLRMGQATDKLAMELGGLKTAAEIKTVLKRYTRETQQDIAKAMKLEFTEPEQTH